MTGDITSASWVSVVPPCAPNVIRLLIDGKVAMTEESFQLDSHPQAGDTTANNDNFLALIHGGAKYNRRKERILGRKDENR